MKATTPILAVFVLLLSACKHDTMVRKVEYQVSVIPASEIKIRYTAQDGTAKTAIYPASMTHIFTIDKSKEFDASLAAIYNGTAVTVTMNILVDGQIVKDRTADLDNGSHQFQELKYTVK